MALNSGLWLYNPCIEYVAYFQKHLNADSLDQLTNTHTCTSYAHCTLWSHFNLLLDATASFDSFRWPFYVIEIGSSQWFPFYIYNGPSISDILTRIFVIQDCFKTGNSFMPLPLSLSLIYPTTVHALYFVFVFIFIKVAIKWPKNNYWKTRSSSTYDSRVSSQSKSHFLSSLCIIRNSKGRRFYSTKMAEVFI